MPKHVLAALFDQSRDCIKVIGADGRLDYMTPNGRLAMEVDDFSQLAGRYWWDLWPPESQHLIRKSVVDGAAGRSSTFEAFCPTAKGTPRWWEVSVTPIVNGETSRRSFPPRVTSPSVCANGNISRKSPSKCGIACAMPMPSALP